MSQHRRLLVGTVVGMVAAAAITIAALSLPAGLGRAAPTGPGPGPAAAAAQPGPVVMTTAPLGDKKTAIFIVDSRNMHLLIYTIDSESRQLRLAAIRDLSNDARVSAWNNAEPLPEDVRQYIESHGPGGKAPGPADQTPKPDAAP